jgi:hypothetical protein
MKRLIMQLFTSLLSVPVWFPVLPSAKCSHMHSVSAVLSVRYCDFGLRSADKILLGLYRRLR